MRREIERKSERGKICIHDGRNTYSFPVVSCDGRSLKKEKVHHQPTWTRHYLCKYISQLSGRRILSHYKRSEKESKMGGGISAYLWIMVRFNSCTRRQIYLFEEIYLYSTAAFLKCQFWNHNERKRVPCHVALFGSVWVTPMGVPVRMKRSARKGSLGWFLVW